MKIKTQRGTISRRLGHNSSGMRYWITIGCTPICEVENQRRIAIGMGSDPFIYQLFSSAQCLAHMCPSICLWLYPNREIDFRFFSTFKQAFTPFYPQRIVSEHTDRDEIFASQGLAKKGPHWMAIANDRHMKVIAYTVRLGTSQDQVEEQPIKGISHSLGFA